MIKQINSLLLKIKKTVPAKEFSKGVRLCADAKCQVLSISENVVDLLISDDDEEIEVSIEDTGHGVVCHRDGEQSSSDAYATAALLHLKQEIESLKGTKRGLEGKAYTREGMMKRVLRERREKAEKANYKIKFADNIYGEHILTNEKGAKYKITLRDFKHETGYIDNPDLKTNKLGTTKHIMFAFAKLKANTALYKRLSKTYPFVEIYLDPQNDYRISWHYPHALKPEVAALIKKYFGKSSYIEDSATKDFLLFIRDAREHRQILIRPEVEEKVRKAWDREMLETLERDTKLDFSTLKVKLFPYQEKGVAFATFREGAVIADEMGLGKTVQAIATAVIKKNIFGFYRTLIICPASLKEQWKQEVGKFCHEQAEVVSGLPPQRKKIYRESTAYFLIANYETVLRDWLELNRAGVDFIILDEAQKIKNFSTVTAQSIKRLVRKHALVITGTPIENRLIDLYSIIQFADPYYLSPLWEFSYQHCYFDRTNVQKITGYFNLKQLNERLKPIVIRRQKREVLSELPKVTELTVPVAFHEEQQGYHANYARGIASILKKKYISPYDQQKLMLLLANMRMVCDSTFLIDKESNVSPKLAELKDILLEKLDLHNNDRKVIIFSEWVTMLNLIGKMLSECHIGYAQLSGRVAVKNRDKLVKKFETDARCKVFLSTEAGGSGLNLQVADTVINFELPWNPAKKNQRIGRIDRLGQRSKNLTVINLVTRGSIETDIASGLILKQNLFDGVLDTSNPIDRVDFSAAGKAQFLQQLEHLMEGFISAELDEQEKVQDTKSDMASVEVALETVTEDDVNEQEAVSEPNGIPVQQAEAMENVMNQGMQFLASLFKMSTGKDMGFDSQKIEIDKKSGEVVLRFKLPKLG